MNGRPTLHLDFETRSAADLRKVGMYRYAENPTTEVICLSYRIGDGPVWRWRPGGSLHRDVAGALVNGDGVFLAHNAGFERVIWNNKMPYVPLLVGQQDCTMARAAAMGLPASLEALGAAIGASVQKDKAGHALMLRMCRPKTREPLTWHETPDEISRLQAYCDQDVDSECAVDGRLPPLSERERRVWILDQHINDRGVAIDVPLVRRAQDAVEQAKRSADDQIWRLTNGAVRKCTEAAKIVGWLKSRGLPCDSIAAEAEEDLLLAADLLEDDLATAVIELRGATAKAFKFSAMLDTVCKDGRVRGSLAYHGAHTGRWAGRGMQPQNFKRMETEEDEAAVAHCISQLQTGQGYGSLDHLSMAARAMIVAPPGRKLVGGDFSNVEGRLNAWFAGEDWKLDAFRALDAGHGPDLYKVMAGRILGKDVQDVLREDRQVMGKVPELACGYQGGVHAIQKSARKAGLKISGPKAEEIKALWRAENPKIVQSWWDLQDAAIDAVLNKGVIVPVLSGKVRYVSNGDYLFCRIPSGRVISYAAPEVRWRSRIVTIDGDEIQINNRGVSYYGVHMGRWMKLDLYGGAQCAHVVSGTARDLLVEGMFNVEAAGYPIVLTIHDEILSEVDAAFGSADEYAELMSRPLAWAEGLPLTTKAWEGDRYAK